MKLEPLLYGKADLTSAPAMQRCICTPSRRDIGKRAQSCHSLLPQLQRGLRRAKSQRVHAEPDASIPPAYRWNDAYPGLEPGDPAASARSTEPWNICFQCNERYLDWNDGATKQLLKTWVQERLGETSEGMDARLATLAAILPDLVGKMERMKADTLLALLQDLSGVTNRVIQLRELLPSLNISRLVAQHPSFVLKYDSTYLASKLAYLRQVLGPEYDAEELIDAEPLMLLADVDAVLQEVARLIPSGIDGREKAAKRFLCGNPRLVLDMEAAGLPSAIDGDLTQQLRPHSDDE